MAVAAAVMAGNGGSRVITWMPSVTRYGAFGKKRSQQTSAAPASGTPARVRFRRSAASTQRSGTQASTRFQSRKPQTSVPVSVTCRSTSATPTPLQASRPGTLVSAISEARSIPAG